MTTRASSRTRCSSVWMWIAGVTSQRPRTTRASLSTTQMSDAVSSCHHSPHGLTNMSVCPSSCQVMCPAMFSANPMPARWRKATASACSLDSSTPIGGTTDGAQTSRPPRRALGAFIIGLHPVFEYPRGAGLWQPSPPDDRGSSSTTISRSGSSSFETPRASRCSTSSGRSMVAAVRRVRRRGRPFRRTPDRALRPLPQARSRGWVMTASSTWLALMFLPPRRMKSDVRPVTVR